MTKFQVSNLSKGTRHLVEIPQDLSKVLKSAQADVHRRGVKVHPTSQLIENIFEL